MRKDLGYEIQINALIPMAEKEARAKVKFTGVMSESRPGAKDKFTGKSVFYNHCFYTEYYHRAMRRLAIENELRAF